MVRSLSKRGMPKPFAILLTALMALYFVPLGALSASAATGDPVVTQEDGVNGCMGVRTTPGSENTNKRLVAGNLEPGGTVTFEISYPVDPADVAGRTTFVITDCVFIDDEPVVKYTVSFVPNTENFVLTFDLVVPEDAVIGAEYCNYAKTTAAPSDSQASNRKAGPACFLIGGDLRILKVDENGVPLAGAKFTVSCVTPAAAPGTAGQAVIISGLVTTPGGTTPATSTTSGTITTATGYTTSNGAIAIAGPAGTSCSVTETEAPPGYQLADPATQTVVIPVGGSSQVVTRFVNRGQGSLKVTKTANAGGTFVFDIDCTGTAYDQDVTIVIPAGGGTVSSTPITAIPAGTECTVTERDNANFELVNIDPNTGEVTITTGHQSVVTFTNRRLTGALTINKTATGAGGTFIFDVDCDGTAYDRLGDNPVTITIPAGGGSDSVVLGGIPTGTECTVAERSNDLFTTVRVPTNGTITIDLNGESVSFTNTRKTGALVVTKSTDEDGTFTFDINCSNDAFDRSGITITTVNGAGSYRLTGIPTTVTCTVAERASGNYSTTVIPADGSVTISVGDNTVAFSNLRRRGALTVVKTADAAGTFLFDVTCGEVAYGPLTITIGADGGTASNSTITGLPTGTSCTVVERNNGLFTTVVVPDDGTVVIGESSNTVAFTNTRKRGDILITKTADAAGSFVFDVDCSDDGYDRSAITVVISAVGGGTVGAPLVSGIPTGTVCTVTERSNPLFTRTLTVPTNGSVTIGTGTNSVAFTNTRDLGQLTINKVLSGPVADASTDFVAHVDCDDNRYDQDVALNARNSYTSTVSIPTGTKCTVTESVIPTGWTLRGISPAGEFTIAATKVTVNVTNARNTGVITVAKSLVGAANGASTAFTFDVDCPGTTWDQVVEVNVGTGSNGSKTTGAIPTGLVCTVTERAAPDWRMTSVVPANGAVTVNSTVTFTNTRLQGTLNLLKAVSPVAGNGVVVEFGDTLTYTLTVSATGEQRQPNVIVTDYLPGSDPARPGSGTTTYVEGSAACIGAGTCTVTGPGDDGLITWSLGEMAAGTTRQVTFQVTIDDVTGADGETVAIDILNAGAVQSDRTPRTPSNEVVTSVSKVLPIKVSNPPEVEPEALPHTGSSLPVGPTVGSALALLGLGLLLTAVSRRRSLLPRR